MTYDFNGLQPVRDAIWNAIFPLPSILQMEVLHHSVWKNQFLVENNWLITIWKAKPQNTLFHFLSAFAAVEILENWLIFQLLDFPDFIYQSSWTVARICCVSLPKN